MEAFIRYLGICISINLAIDDIESLVCIVLITRCPVIAALIAIYEILEFNDEVRSAVSEMKDSEEIKNIAIKNGMITFEDTYKKLLEEKVITIEEYLISNCTQI